MNKNTFSIYREENFTERKEFYCHKLYPIASEGKAGCSYCWNLKTILWVGFQKKYSSKVDGNEGLNKYLLHLLNRVTN